VSDFHVVKENDSTSPLLLKAANDGTKYSPVVLEGVGEEEVVKHTFTDVMVTNVQFAGGEDKPYDNVAFSFKSFQTETRPRKSKPAPQRTAAPAAAAPAPATQSGPTPPPPKSPGPVGSGEHIVQQGECILSIARDHGHLFETIFSHPNNAQLRAIRKDPNILLPGDRVHIPEKQRKQAPCQTAMNHVFRKKGSGNFRLRLVEEPQPKNPPPPPPQPVNRGPKGRDFITQDAPPQTHKVDDVPRANVPFKLVIDDSTITGATDADGCIEVAIKPNGRGGKLILDPGTPNELTLPIELGFLNPITEISGVKQRLTNLSFACNDRTEVFTPALQAALKAFQEKNGLNVTGTIDQATRDKLKELHGC
jgi:hypothetical protein